MVRGTFVTFATKTSLFGLSSVVGVLIQRLLGCHECQPEANDD